MDDLRDQGLTYREISELLNLKGILSPTNRQYNERLVERSLSKFNKRQERLADSEIISLKEHYEIKIDDLRSDWQPWSSTQCLPQCIFV